jgi:alpha-ketoglutaric semialdehyde dehydrogenase
MNNVRLIPNWIAGEELAATSGEYLIKVNPHTAQVESHFSASSVEDVDKAITVAEARLDSWSKITPVARGNILGAWVRLIREHQNELAEIVARETGKPPQDALGEVGAAIAQGEYFSGEGMRLYGRSLTSGMQGKYAHTVRQARGVVGLIVPANTPIANISWKVFPALICGNTVVLKASEDAPEIALRMAQLAKQAGVPDGVLNVIQGAGDPAGKTLVEDSRVAVISFTGSTEVGRWIAEVAGRRLARVSLELGGKNPFVVCDDADLDAAVHWASLSAFSNAGQRCASGSRILVFEKVYDDFVSKLVAKAKSLKLGIEENCDLGPVINARQQSNIFSAIDRAIKSGGNLLSGGTAAPTSKELESGFYVEPTIIADLPYDAELCSLEIFGPVVIIQRVKDSEHALQVANSTDYGLTAAVHTTNVDRAMWFAQQIRAGTVNINIGTYGSEPHMPFGGFGASGNGTREPGVEALDVYSELKNISFLVRDTHI